MNKGISMKFKNHNTEIDETNPFKNDWLKRQEFSNQLTNIIKNNSEESFVIGLSAQWGEGKTTFVKMWQKQMENAGINCIYFDAFEYDYMENVFLSIAIEIYNFAKNKDLALSTNYLEESKSVFSHLQSIKMNTSPIILESQLFDKPDEVNKNTVADDIEDNLNYLLNNAFNQAINHKEVFTSFKKSLSILASSTSSKNLPLIIIIDELDRCKPNYAVEVLEKIKHLFLVDNVVFVLSMHHEQLEESIKKVYGSNLDAHTYLQKFIDYPTRLPKANFSLDRSTGDYLRNQINFLKFREFDSSPYVFRLFAILSNYYDLSHRQINKALYTFKMFIDSQDINFGIEFQKACLYIFVSILKVANNELIQKIRTNSVSMKDMNNELGSLYSKDHSDVVTSLKLYIELCFQNFEYFQNTHEQREIDFFRVFKLSREENLVLKNTLASLESFESY